ncbi:hypothetical protein IAQ61_001967 [Plenodomus lingam]|uniref:uncharacterized protein n=1 Tax=Leptosphaeria maculans TaxID=5022 RepID=UPI00331CB1FD|nr:hypothetical protein IAQ61_001967 [Plenodomus lingam]
MTARIKCIVTPMIEIPVDDEHGVATKMVYCSGTTGELAPGFNMMVACSCSTKVGDTNFGVSRPFWDHGKHASSTIIATILLFPPEDLAQFTWPTLLTLLDDTEEASILIPVLLFKPHPFTRVQRSISEEAISIQTLPPRETQQLIVTQLRPQTLLGHISKRRIRTRLSQAA